MSKAGYGANIAGYIDTRYYACVSSTYSDIKINKQLILFFTVYIEIHSPEVMVSISDSCSEVPDGFLSEIT
jgi:hypothetical protein